MSKVLGIRISLEPGLFVTLSMKEVQARQLIQLWSTGDLQMKGVVVLSHLNFPSEGGEPWATRLDKVIAINTFSLEAAQQAGQPASVPQNPWKGGGSGFPN